MEHPFEPKLYSRAAFGLEGKPAWGGPDNPSPHARAARVQDLVARAVRRHVRENGTTLTEFAKKIDMDRARLSRLLGGRQWASLVDIEVLLGACGETLTSLSLDVGNGSHQAPRVQRILTAYLREQIQLVEAGSVRNEPAHPLNPDQRLPGDLA